MEYTEKVFKPKITYVMEDNVLEKIEVDKNVFLRLIQADDLYIDVRKFYKGFPTKQGVRFKFATYEEIKNVLNKYGKNGK